MKQFEIEGAMRSALYFLNTFQWIFPCVIVALMASMTYCFLKERARRSNEKLITNRYNADGSKTEHENRAVHYGSKAFFIILVAFTWYIVRYFNI